MEFVHNVLRPQQQQTLPQKTESSVVPVLAALYVAFAMLLCLWKSIDLMKTFHLVRNDKEVDYYINDDDADFKRIEHLILQVLENQKKQKTVDKVEDDQDGVIVD